jgi:AraC-like DNA-binding protein
LIFNGYPAALTVGRANASFSDDELERIADALRSLGHGSDESRAADEPPAFLAVDDSGVARYGGDASPAMLEHCKDQLATLAASLRQSDAEVSVQQRFMLTLASGAQTAYRAVRHAHYPALGEGAITLLAKAPSRSDWLSLRSEMVAADADFHRFMPAIRMVARDYATQPSLKALAAAVHLSPFHFHRSFSEATGTTPKHLMLDCQIDAAKAALRDGQMTMSEIAEVCGFAHQSHFTSRFKQATGATPTQWRRLTTA